MLIGLIGMIIEDLLLQISRSLLAHHMEQKSLLLTGNNKLVEGYGFLIYPMDHQKKISVKKYDEILVKFCEKWHSLEVPQMVLSGIHITTCKIKIIL